MNDTSPEITDSSPLKSNPDRPAKPKSTWRAVLLLAVVLGAVAVSQTLLRRDSPEQVDEPAAGDPPAASAETATLVIEPAAGQSQEWKVAWREGMTVLDLFQGVGGEQAAKIESLGSGELTFITSIGGAENEGADGRNWQFYVNGERSNVGAGAYVVESGDHVLWKLAAKE